MRFILRTKEEKVFQTEGFNKNDNIYELPKTRTGKIMRRVLKAQELGMEIGDISTLVD